MAGNVNYDGNIIPSEWLLNGNYISNTSSGNSVVEASSALVVNHSYHHPIDVHSLAYCNMNVESNVSSSISLNSGVNWMPNAILGDGIFMPAISSILPPLPSDSTHPDFAAKFSCSSDIPNPLSEGNEKQSASANYCDEAEFRGQDGLVKGVGLKKRRRSKQVDGKFTKEETKGCEEGEIHVRAGKSRATNSHTLAERIRREKISERMKQLQDIVPGCNKVTGKAVMLDEIINYVQSLQQQVEFLSMKLATLNPQLEGFVGKDILQFLPFPPRNPH